MKILRGLPRNPCTANVNYERSVRFENVPEGFSEELEPLDVLVGVHIPILLLSYEAKGRTGKDKVYRMGCALFEVVKRIAMVNETVLCPREEDRKSVV